MTCDVCHQPITGLLISYLGKHLCMKCMLEFLKAKADRRKDGG